MSEIFYTPGLVQNAPFAHLRAPRRCQSVVLSVHMAKTRHSGRMHVWAKNGPKTARNATELARPDFNYYKVRPSYREGARGALAKFSSWKAAAR